VRWNPARSKFDIEAGRLFAPDLAAVSLFDGVIGRYTSQHWGAGLFSGWQPEPVDLAYSSDITEHGGFVEFHSRPGASTRWSITTGLIGSYEDGEVNREYLYIQGRVSSRRISAYLAQEVDYNRDWKEEVEGDTLQGTSTFASLTYRAASWLMLRAGFDDRRNVRLYRDRSTPETEFDDEFRQGEWLGATFRWADHWRLGLDARSRSGGSSGDADSYTATFGVGNLTAWDLGVSARGTSYENDDTKGWLYSLAVDFAPVQRLRMSVFGGVRTEESTMVGNLDETIPWYGMDLDLYLAKRWFLLLSAEFTNGDLEEYQQYYASLSYRF
jgi:hypothetical protein